MANKEVTEPADNLTFLEDLRAALDNLPGVEIRSVEPEPLGANKSPVDVGLLADIKGRPALILIEVKALVYPRDARAAAWQAKMVSYADDSTPTKPTVHMIAAPAISRSSRELLRDEGLAYWDQSGSLYLEVPWAFYFVDRSKQGKSERPIRNIYRGSTAQVLHAMLIEPDRRWHVQELAEIAGVSPSTVHEVFTFLENQLWAEKVGSGPSTVRTLTKPGALLDAWAGEHSLKQYKTRRFYRWVQSRGKLKSDTLKLLHDDGMDYALTLASGAEYVAPYTTSIDNLHILVPETADITTLAERGGLKPVESGENITFLVSSERSPLMFRQHLEDTDIADNIQLYLDLWAWPRRGKEQAEHLRSSKIGY
ncbi:MAG: hypothetical protein IVW55_12070 [Chloroflexi bacterium]|nr:hypothetical protein [Chloroflexota bacterium]